MASPFFSRRKKLLRSFCKQDLEAERQTFKTKWLEDIGSDWDDNKVYPSCSDSSITTDSSEDEALAVGADKTENKQVEDDIAAESHGWTVGALCKIKYRDGKFYPAEVVKIEGSCIWVSYTECVMCCVSNALLNNKL